MNPHLVGTHEIKVTRDRYKLCPSCGNYSHFAEGQTYCIICGAKMICECADCLEPIIYPTAKHCPSCGTGYHEKFSEAVNMEIRTKIG